MLKVFYIRKFCLIIKVVFGSVKYCLLKILLVYIYIFLHTNQFCACLNIVRVYEHWHYNYSLLFTNLMHKFFISIHLLHSSTCFEHYCAHLQEDNCINTASGIVTLFRCLFSSQVRRGHIILLYMFRALLCSPSGGQLH